MKKSYKYLLIYSISLIILLLINSFVFNFLSGYKMVLLLAISLILFDKIFVIEKDNHMYMKDIIKEILLYVLSFLIIYYFLGLIVGLTRIPNYYSFEGIKTIILPIILVCILREIFRYNMLCKAEGSKSCNIVVVLLFIFIEITGSIYYLNYTNKYDVLNFIALSLFPAIAKNISYSYITKKTGFRPIIIFDLIHLLIPYLVPYIPNLSEYMTSIINILIPILFAVNLAKFIDAKEKNMIPIDYHKKKYEKSFVPAAIIIMIVYFYSGYFKYFTIAIASDSMSPLIKKGDIVIVDKKCSYNDLEKGDIIAFKKEAIIVVHRIFKKVKIGDSYLIYTKGDANNNIDDFVIEKDMIVGKVKQKISSIGYPTVWFNEFKEN